ncbi:MAG: hypothetical protein KIT69_02075 [Propionibacteriaceae bacterium]|nr:hypothetical protein [Propionibacteriaceae bacterium]
MRRSLRLLARPGLAALLSAQLLARLPIGMWPIGILLHIQQRTGSYAAAGLVAALMTLGRAVGTPVASRLAGRWGPRRLLIVTTAGSGLAAAVLAGIDLTGLPLALAMLGYGTPALLSGLLTPPVQPIVRSAYPGVVEPAGLEHVFSLDAAAQEIIFVIGPVLAFGVAGWAGPAWTLLAGVAGQVAGTCWLLRSTALGDAVPAAERGRAGRVLAMPAVLAGTLVGLLLVGASSAVEAAVTAVFGEALTAGLLLALYSVASLVGGLVFSHWTSGRFAQPGWMAVVGFGLLLAPLRPETWWLAVALMVAGLGVAPVFAAVAQRVSSRTTSAQATEAFGWVDSGAIVGASLGFGLAGTAIESGGAGAALWLAAGLALAGSALAAGAVALDHRR